MLVVFVRWLLFVVCLSLNVVWRLLRLSLLHGCSLLVLRLVRCALFVVCCALIVSSCVVCVSSLIVVCCVFWGFVACYVLLVLRSSVCVVCSLFCVVCRLCYNSRCLLFGVLWSLCVCLLV